MLVLYTHNVINTLLFIIIIIQCSGYNNNNSDTIKLFECLWLYTYHIHTNIIYIYTVYYSHCISYSDRCTPISSSVCAAARFVRLILDALSPKRLFGKIYYFGGYTMYVYVCKVENYTHADPDTDTHPDWICIPKTCRREICIP